MNLKFEITNDPFWRRDDSSDVPSVKEMLEDIANYFKTWKSYKEEVCPDKIKEKLWHIKLEYLLHTQTVEDIGVQNYKDTKEIMEEIDKICRESTKDTKEIMEEIDKICGEKASVKSSTSSIIKKFSKKRIVRETVNLYLGLKHLESIIENEKCESAEEQEKLDKLLDIQESVLKLHKILTKCVIPEDLIPGEFTTLQRGTGLHTYPHFSKPEFVEVAIQSILDAYNERLDSMKLKIQTEVTADSLEIIFKIAALVFFSFTGIHPFPDGNGRTARLLCSHILQLFSPFQTPVYNMFSPARRMDYGEAIRNAEKSINSDVKVNDETEAFNIAHKYLEASPSDLCSMIIECNWYAWQELLGIRNLDKIKN